MNIRKEFQRVIYPLLKASPILIGLVIATVFLAKRGVEYLPHEFQSMGAMKINNLNSSQTGFDLFQSKNSNTPMQNETFLTEVEIFKSKDLIKKTIEQLDWELTIYRLGDVRTSELYKERPFQIEYNIKNGDVYDKNYYLKYAGSQVFHLLKTPKQDTNFVEIPIGSLVELTDLSIKITLEEAFMLSHPKSLSIGDLFIFKINSLDALVNSIDGKNLFVRPVEKDISIIKIYFNHGLPSKAQNFVNTLMNTYVEECRSYKEKMSDETLEYIDKSLEEAALKLRTSESELALFRTSQHLVNTRQETEATLREITQLDMQQIDFNMQKSALEKLYKHLTSGNNLNDYAPNFKSLSDPIFQQSYLKVQALEVEKQDLLQKYVPESIEVAHVDSKIKTLRVFINESVRATLNGLITREKEINRSIKEANTKINTYPEKERKLVILERTVSLNENTYNYLVQKRTELAISRSSNLYPHKIIEQANLPTNLTSPNKPLIIGLCVFLVLGIGIIFAYIYDFFTARIHSKEDIEEAFHLPLIGTVWKKRENQLESFEMVSGLIANIFKLPESKIEGQGKLLVISSMHSGEGKSFTSSNLAETLANSNKRVLLVDMDIYRPSLHKEWNLPNEDGVSAVLEGRCHPLHTIHHTGIENLHFIPAGQLKSRNRALFFSGRSTGFVQDMRWHYDVVIVDSAPVGIVPDAIPLMHQSTANLFIIRSGHTKRRLTTDIQKSLAEWKIPNLYLVLNDSSPSKKYAGYPGYNQDYQFKTV